MPGGNTCLICNDSSLYLCDVIIVARARIVEAATESRHWYCMFLLLLRIFDYDVTNFYCDVCTRGHTHRLHAWLPPLWRDKGNAVCKQIMRRRFRKLRRFRITRESSEASRIMSVTSQCMKEINVADSNDVRWNISFTDYICRYFILPAGMYIW